MIENTETMKIAEIVGSPNCVDTLDGHVAYQAISTELGAGHKVLISFEGVERVTTAFLNAAVGQLYNEFSEDDIRRNVRFIDVSSISSDALRKVIERAKVFFADPEKYNAVTSDVLEDN